MKTIRNLLIVLLLITLACEVTRAQDEATSGKLLKEFYYAVEINDVICGYSLGTVNEALWEGQPSICVQEDVSLKLKLLGQGMDITFHHLYYLDPETERYTYSEVKISNGGVNLNLVSRVIGDSLYFTSTMGGAPSVFYLDEGVILESPLSYPHLMSDVVEKGISEISYQVFDNVQGKIVEKKYWFLGNEPLHLTGITFDAIKFDELNTTTGEKLTLWLNSADGSILKFYTSGRSIYLTEQSDIKQVQVADVDNRIFARVKKSIPDVHGISYMKVKAKIESAGEWITVENLNFPGQVFTGTVDENLIEGVFEIEPIRYDGANTPAFPYDFEVDESMQKYLEPEDLIESDHPSIINEAKNITHGATNAWEAAIRLSDWVANNIKGAIPGGGSAINTYNTREGECGSHSRLLAAFCRAVGIPARLSVGCMYTTYLGGSFGQHAWTEIFMGDAGWVSVDATAFEIDFVDAGHIRLGEMTSFNPIEMEIIEYKHIAANNYSIAHAVPAKYEPYLGNYTNVGKGKVLKVFYQEGSMAVDIPEKIVLALEDENENGVWYPKMTRQINFSFMKDDKGKVKQMVLQQMIPVPKKSSLEEEMVNVPEEIQPFLGKYFLAQINAEFKVNYLNGNLLMFDALSKKDIILRPTGEARVFNDGTEKRKFSFETDETGDITNLVIYDNLYMPKGVPVSMVMAKTIENAGIDDGIKKYYELKETKFEGYIFGEQELNALGYQLLSKDQTDDAVAVFEINILEYPDSWNAYDSMGEAYLAQGNSRLAKKSYKKSIRLNPENENGKAMLRKMKKQL